MPRDERYEARKTYISGWARRRYQYERENGICVYCHNPWKGLRSYCDACAERTLERRKAKHKKDRDAKREVGMCPRCGHERHEEADDGKITCFSCRADAALRKGYSI